MLRVGVYWLISWENRKFCLEQWVKFKWHFSRGAMARPRATRAATRSRCMDMGKSSRNNGMTSSLLPASHNLFQVEEEGSWMEGRRSKTYDAIRDVAENAWKKWFLKIWPLSEM